MKPNEVDVTGQQQVAFRCYSYQRKDGRWYAHCIDLTLDALAPTQAEAVAKLNNAISQYLSWAAEGGLTPVAARRPSRLAFRVEYHRRRLTVLLGGLIRRAAGKPGRSASESIFTVRQPLSV